MGLNLIVSLMTVLLIALPAEALAHVKNEETQFPDIEFSDARFDIVLLAAAGLIPETPVFEPDRPLSRRDLASWIALAEGLGEGGETPDTDALAQAAFGAGKVQSLDGEATLGELSAAFFGEQVKIEVAGETPTKAAAATFLAEHLATPMDGITLLARAGVSEGPTGEIREVRSERTADGDNAYFITIGEMTAPAYQHVRVANGPTDLLAWQGRIISRSFTRTFNGQTLWVYLEAESMAAPAASGETGAEQQTQAAETKSIASSPLFYGLVAGVLVLGVVLFARKRRTP